MRAAPVEPLSGGAALPSTNGGGAGGRLVSIQPNPQATAAWWGCQVGSLSRALSPLEQSRTGGDSTLSEQGSWMRRRS